MISGWMKLIHYGANLARNVIDQSKFTFHLVMNGDMNGTSTNKKEPTWRKYLIPFICMQV